LAEQQLEAYANSQQIMVDAEYLLLEGMATETDFANTRAYDIIASVENFDGKSVAEQKKMVAELQKMANNAALYAFTDDRWNDFVSDI
jgi:stress-induced morphogen